MITSTKEHIKKTNKQKWADRTLGQMVKAVQTKSHREAYTYTLTKREKGKKYIYLYIKKKGREQPHQ